MTKRCEPQILGIARQLPLSAAAIAFFVATGLFVKTASAQQEGTVNSNPDQAVGSTSSNAAANSDKPSADLVNKESSTIEKIVASGRVLMIGETSSSRLTPAVRLAPGAPPILAFRYLDGQARHRFGDLDLVMDDAGH